MNTITICAYNRPAYLDRVLASLGEAVVACPEFCVDRIILGIDAGGLQLSGMSLSDRVEVLYWPEHLGVTEHPRRLLQHVFMELGSTFNLHLEDDTVLAPDAIRLVEWFRSHMPDPAHILSLHSRATELDGIVLDPARVKRRDDFGVWGWATTSYVARRYILPYWNHKRVGPLGWDYSLTETVKQFGLTVLAPELSRVENIGREGGAHGTPEQWDKDLADQVVADADDMQEIGDFHT